MLCYTHRENRWPGMVRHADYARRVHLAMAYVVVQELRGGKGILRSCGVV
jgi:hypothetical protein